MKYVFIKRWYICLSLFCFRMASSNNIAVPDRIFWKPNPLAFFPLYTCIIYKSITIKRVNKVVVVVVAVVVAVIVVVVVLLDRPTCLSEIAVYFYRKQMY